MQRRYWAALLLFGGWQTIGWAGAIGFLAYQDNAWSLYRWDLHNPPQKIFSSPVLRDWAVSPDQNLLVFSTTDGRMWKYDLETKTQTPLNPEGEDWQNPAFLSNGKLIAVKNIFSRDRDESDLLLYDLAGGKVAQTLEQTGTEEYPAPHPKEPDSIAYVSILNIFPSQTLSAIWIVHPVHGRNRRLTDYAEGHIRPYFVPGGMGLSWLEPSGDGNRLHFSSLGGTASEPSMELCPGPCEALLLTLKEVLIAEFCGEGSCLRIKDLGGMAEVKIRPFDKEVRIREMGMWP